MVEAGRFGSRQVTPDGNRTQGHVQEGRACSPAAGWERERGLTCAREPIPVVQRLALTRVVLHADGVG